MSENETKTEYIQLSEEELEKQWDKLDKDVVSACQKMSLEFITKHERDIEFNLLSVNPYLTYDIIDKYLTKINWINLCMAGGQITNGFIFNYRTKMVWNLLLNHQILDNLLLVQLATYYKTKGARCKNAKMFWSAISRTQPLDADFIEYFKRNINFEELSQNKYLTSDIVDKYINRLDIPLVLANIKVDEEVIKKHITKISRYLK